MMGLLLTVLALVSTYGVTRLKGVGHGLGVLFLFGYFYGMLRARFPDGLSHFIFDAGVMGLYLAFFTKRSKSVRLGRDGQALRLWVKALMVWPLCTLVLSPLFDSQHIFIQFVGLRMAILLLPLMLIGLRLEAEDLDRLGTWLLWLNLVAFGFALLELALGIEPFFPRNASSYIIYISRDVGEEGLPRIPATFNSAHAYAGTMLMSLPLLVRRIGRSKAGRLLTFATLGTSVLGIFICAARSPVVQLVAIGGLLLLVTRLSVKLLGGMLVVGVLVGLIVSANPRFQRFSTLDDTDAVTDRVSLSVNTSVFDVVTTYPLGNGLGSAAGTSIPFFLSHLAKPQVGFENEFARVAMEQGFIGLVLWLGFLAWFLIKLPPRRRKEQVVANRMMWATVVVMWMTALIGTGLLASVPGSALLLLWMGTLIGMRRPVPALAPPLKQPVPAVQPASTVIPLPGLPEAVRR
ncbi:hypothetical protein [Vitiosangium sp. GDMCC 1.1324]|uniref:hypothetical protein n=1 Tax=Vitiosangium sp. (strain GDMCC 1.1324) TaxID=2138576 RepID=UPI000D3A918E|nr:hypothetical protein [Vitiosangium sp. GDMCC 1.1324]PTL81836.1 hypothetical protein DAT35_23180 [Vitiosangium sp. GDMCC 1.1324]